MKMKSSCVFLESMNMRPTRGEPMLPKVLYSPRRPSVKVVFIYMCCNVSTSASVLSPNLSSTVHTLIPLGISWLEPSESVFTFLSEAGRNCPSSLIELKSFCAATGMVAAHINRVASIFFIIS